MSARRERLDFGFLAKILGFNWYVNKLLEMRGYFEAEGTCDE